MLLKHIYSNRILALVCNHITYITKEDFLLAFKVTYNKDFIKNNIHISFKGTKLVLFNLDIVILKLNIQLYILILPIQQHTA